MLEPELVSELLETLTDNKTARVRGKEIRTLRGVRGVPTGEIARVGAAVWEDQAPSLSDEAGLTRLFGTAWEDGLVAIGLLAAILPDDPSDALDLGREWAERIDDYQTADALGSLVLGPGVLASGQDPLKALGPLLRHRRPAVRRAAVMAGLAMLPEVLTGPAVAPLRARMGSDAITFVAEPHTQAVLGLAQASVRDEDPSVRKALRRVLTVWAKHDPDAAQTWISGVRGGVPKVLREAVEKGARKARRLARDAAKAAAQAQTGAPEEGSA